MTEKQALRLAIQEMKRGLKYVAFDANMAERFGATYPQALTASKHKQCLKDGIAVLEKMLQ